MISPPIAAEKFPTTNHMNPNTTTRPNIAISDFRISTDIALNPEFVKNPIRFMLSHNVNLVDTFQPEVSFKQDT